MEIKVQCACGEKYKFEVEPVHGRMPAPVNCPSCGADGTIQANEYIRENLASTAPSGANVSTAPGPASPPPVPRLRVGSPASTSVGAPPPPPIPPPIASASAHPPLSAPPRLTALPPRPGAKPKAGWVKGVTAVLIGLFLGFAAWRIGSRWFSRIHAVVTMAQMMSESAKDPASAVDEHQNLDFEDAVVLYVAHSNHMVVLAACQDYWRDRLHKKLTVMPDTETNLDTGEYELIPAHNGYVRIVGGLDWPQAQYEGLAEYLSQRFGTLVFEARDVDFSGAYHFGVYERGDRKFHAQMDVKVVNGEDQEIVTTEGNDWALTNGYTPGPEGFSTFHLGDADKITQYLGMKLWDEPEEVEVKGVFLKE